MQKWNCFDNQMFNVRKQKIHKDWRNQLWAEDDEEPQPGENTKHIIVYCDNVSATYLSTNRVQYQRTKRTNISRLILTLFVKLLLQDKLVFFMFPRIFHWADIFTKGLPTALFLEVRSSLNVRIPSAPTARVYLPIYALSPLLFISILTGLSSHYIVFVL